MIAIQRARAVVKDANLRVVPADPGDEDAVEPRAAPLEQSPAATRPQAAATDSSAVTTAESSEKVEELLEDFVAALLNAPGLSDQSGSLWEEVALALPDELYDRLDGWIEKQLMGTG